MRANLRTGLLGMAVGLAIAAVPSIGRAGSVGTSLYLNSSSASTPDVLGTGISVSYSTTGVGFGDLGLLTVSGTSNTLYPQGLSGSNTPVSGSYVLDAYISSAGQFDSVNSTLDIKNGSTTDLFKSSNLTKMAYSLTSSSPFSGALNFSFGHNSGTVSPGNEVDVWIKLTNAGVTGNAINQVFGSTGWTDTGGLGGEVGNAFTPAPLPSSLHATGLLLAGVGVFGFLRRRRQFGAA